MLDCLFSGVDACRGKTTAYPQYFAAELTTCCPLTRHNELPCTIRENTRALHDETRGPVATIDRRGEYSGVYPL